MKHLLHFLKWAFVLLFGYILVVLIFGTINDFHAEEVAELSPFREGEYTGIIPDTTFSLTTWNIGYAGLGAEADFFYDGGGMFFSGGKMVRPPRKMSEGFLSGIEGTVAATQSDFFLLQEVDRDAKRSYRIDQLARIAGQLPQYAAFFCG